jgi:cytochrome c-type biogenesis protein CcmE
MKKLHVIVLVLIAAAIAVLISYMGNTTTYETFASAKEKQGKAVSVFAKLDKGQQMEYDPVRNPNYLSFMAKDTLGNAMQVVYHQPKPTDMEKSERIVLKGKVINGYFDCSSILLKCPSKYKDDPNAAKDMQVASASAGQ